MTSEAKIASNRRNAKKSTGPRSLVGKNRSRLNSLKHGMQARVILLPDEDPTAFKARMVGWVESLKPRNRIELFLAERAVYLSWQLDRVSRAQSAGLCLKALTAVEDREEGVQEEFAELTRRMFRNTRGRLAGYARAERQASQPGDPSPGAFDDANHPAFLVGRLEFSGRGCRWLLERWNELGAILEAGWAWQASDRFKAIRLLRIHPIDILGAPETTALLQACQVLDPDAGDLVKDLWRGLVPADQARSLEKLFAGRLHPSLPPDEPTARQQLLKIVKRETKRLGKKVERHQNRAELEASLSKDRLAFDDSAQGEMLRRYELNCNEFLFRILDDLTKRRPAKADRSEPVYTGYRTFSSDCFELTADMIDSPGAIDRSDPVDTRGASEIESETNGRNNPDALRATNLLSMDGLGLDAGR